MNMRQNQGEFGLLEEGAWWFIAVEQECYTIV
jgi:hypothetical protein